MASGALDFSREPLRDSITTESFSKVIVVQILMGQEKGVIHHEEHGDHKEF
jgi:hypothetical protein